ncbi:MAG: hypothetical protein AAF555_08105 [Verrucomicrobiota bacterium]
MMPIFLLWAALLLFSEWKVSAQDQVTKIIPPNIINKLPPRSIQGLPNVGGEWEWASNSPVVRRYLQQGMASIYAFDDYEASRAFSAALLMEPECVMAYWGLSVSLLTHNHEYKEFRRRAFERALALAPAAGRQEQLYIDSLIALRKDGLPQMVAVLGAIAEEFPEDRHAQVLHAFLSQDGFDAEGQPLPKQKDSLATFERLAGLQPDNPIFKHFLLLSYFRGPDPEPTLRVAKELVSLGAASPYQLFSGASLLYLSGNWVGARVALEKARADYEQGFQAGRAEPFEKVGYLKTLELLASVAVEQGAAGEAQRLARELSAIRFPSNRFDSAGAGFQFYRGQTLPTRLAIRQRLWQAAWEALPESDALRRDYGGASNYFLEGSKRFLEGMRALEAGEVEEALRLHALLVQAGEGLAASGDLAKARGNAEEWGGAIKTLHFYERYLRAAVYIRQGEIGLAGTWFKILGEKAGQGNRLPPPVLLAPIEEFMGWAYLAGGRTDLAEVSFRQCFAIQPGNAPAVLAIARLLAEAGHEKRAASAYRRFLEIWEKAPPTADEVQEARRFLDRAG